MSEEQKRKRISRRDFLKSSAVTFAAVGVAGCAPKTLPPQETPSEGVPEVSQGTTPEAAVSDVCSCDHLFGYSGVGDWLGDPPSVPEVSSTVDVDVLVIGAGHAGLMGALSAAEAGAKVAVIEKKDEAGFFTDYYHRVGEDIGHVNSKWLIDKGFGPYDTGEIVDEFVKRAGGRVNRDIIRMYVENSGAMFDHMVEIYKEYEDFRKKNFSAVEFEYTGDNPRKEVIDFSNMLSDEMVFVQTQLDRDPKDYPIVLGGYKTWPCNAMFQGPALHEPVTPFVSALRFFETVIDQKTKDLGVKWYYEHSAVVLVQNDNGDVTGAIVQDKEQKYIQFNASKGVLVTTGDFVENPEMCWALMNELMEFNERAGKTKNDLGGMGFLKPRGADGYGHKLCCWAGGMIEPGPRPFMGLSYGVTGPWGASPMLMLNAYAKRFCNEAAAPLIGAAVVRQPIGLLTLVTDKKYMESIKIAGLEHGGPNFGRADQWLPDFLEDMDKVIGAGADGYSVRGITVAERNPTKVYGANTLEELAGYLGYEGEYVNEFVQSVKRYNELCYAKVDTDYGKDPIAMIPIDEPPFYGVKGSNSGTLSLGLVTLAGMVTDNNLNVLDKSGKPIKGLYVAGNTLGGRYGLGYTTPFAGNSVGMALTHGWMAGKIITGTV